MLENLVIGWEKIEPVFLINVALNRPFILLGRHGTCKTTCAKEIAQIFGKKSYRFYDATKDDLISIAGIPIPQKLAEGKLEFSKHDRSIWDAKVIVVDELTRANRENQNLWLEILEEKSCFGKKLCYETLIATMNPESYAATFKLDEALLDRFYAVIPVPDLQKGTSSATFKRVIRMNMKEQVLSQEALKKLVDKIRDVYEVIHNNRTVVNAVSEYVSNYMEILHGRIDSYISPRKTIHLVEEIIGLSAYFRLYDRREYLSAAAKTALLYVLGIPFKIKPEVLMQVHANLRQILAKKAIDSCEKIRIDLAKLSDDDSLIKYVKKNILRIKRHLPFDEAEKLLAQVVDQCKVHDLPTLRTVLGKIEGHEEQKRIVEARILFYEIKAVDAVLGQLIRYKIYNERDFTVFDRLKTLIQELKKLPLDKKMEKFIFQEKVDCRKLVRQVRKGGFDAVKTKTDPGLQGAGIEPS